VEGDDAQIDWRFPFLLTLVSVAVIAVWCFTLANEWYLYTMESVPVIWVTFFVGTPSSLGGTMAALLGWCERRSRNRRWWLINLLVNMTALAANLVAFVLGSQAC
jgi:hypothetical protein